ncbi:GNAT family N-acetyltransferase [Priestia taiwanensis]|uniref:Acetyltransferase n=1 Tax=Priestia taiwanensis TaxID=1347902 RepID=A0A917EMQ9_9BACI|nr:GNAT family N-acetyltransferase [Priestia taiwanensis]MBM7362649.1 ribosomal protein S18 acetylase RimI-like enzyme [Priestia taiwanensis]GGE63946.1 acetyltransferase [Priestia taiwanensis]
MNIRKAQVEDAAGIARVHVDCWRTTYKDIIPEDFLCNLSYENRTKLWLHNIQREDNYLFVAENEDGEIIGFADGGKRETNTVENSGDLTSIYIFESYQKQGIGKKLCQPLFQVFRDLGYTTIFVEVLEDNKSKYFYEALGAKLCKDEEIVYGGKMLNLLTYEWGDIRHI